MVPNALLRTLLVMTPEVGPVQEVEALDAELQVGLLPDLGVLHEGEVPLREARARGSCCARRFPTVPFAGTEKISGFAM